MLEQVEYYTLDWDEKTIDNYAIKKKITLLNLKFGILFSLEKHFYVDVFSGLGIKYRNNKKTYKEYDADAHNVGGFSGPNFKNKNLSKNEIIPNSSLGGKFGIKF